MCVVGPLDIAVDILTDMSPASRQCPRPSLRNSQVTMSRPATGELLYLVILTSGHFCFPKFFIYQKFRMQRGSDTNSPLPFSQVRYLIFLSPYLYNHKCRYVNALNLYRNMKYNIISTRANIVTPIRTIQEGMVKLRPQLNTSIISHFIDLLTSRLTQCLPKYVNSSDLPHLTSVVIIGNLSISESFECTAFNVICPLIKISS